MQITPTPLRWDGGEAVLPNSRPLSLSSLSLSPSRTLSSSRTRGQVMVMIDNSRSMGEAGPLALAALATISTALARLEVGQVPLSRPLSRPLLRPCTGPY